MTGATEPGVFVRKQMKSSMTPSLEERPGSFTVEKAMNAGAAALYRAWTKGFDLWFAQPGELIMSPEIDRPFFFYNRHDWGRHAHYGRFLQLEQDRLVEMTWVTGKGGTFGAETVLRIELLPQDKGTLLRLTHAGFDDANAAKTHEENWPLALEELERKLAGD